MPLRESAANGTHGEGAASGWKYKDKHYATKSEAIAQARADNLLGQTAVFGPSLVATGVGLYFLQRAADGDSLGLLVGGGVLAGGFVWGGVGALLVGLAAERAVEEVHEGADTQ